MGSNAPLPIETPPSGNSIETAYKSMSNPKLKLVKRASISSIVVAAVLVVSKFLAWLHTDSLSLQASLVDSVIDIGSSIINFLIIREAIKPADKEHQFGHGKAEAIGGLAQTAFIAGSAGWLLFDAAHRIVAPHPIADVWLGNIIMTGAVVMTTALVLFQRWVVKKTGSIAIKADSLHYETDLWSNIGVLISLNVSVYLQVVWLDVLVGAGIAIYLFLTSLKVAKASLDILMDKELDDDIRENIVQIATSHKDVVGYHELKTRSAGYHIFIQLHLELDKKMTLEKAHDVSQEVTDMIQKNYHNAEVIIHQDPV